MFTSVVNINQVPTEIIAYNCWIEEVGLDINGKKDIVILITGNPGVPAFYKEFASQLQSMLPTDVPIWIIGHTGHAINPEDNVNHSYPDLKTHSHLYNLNGNLEHKVQFVRKYSPADARIHLIGHSIGAWFVLNLLKNNDIEKKVSKCYLLFPTLERLAETVNGKFLINFALRISFILVFLSWIFTLFPYFLQASLIRIFGFFYGIPSKLDDAILQLVSPLPVQSAFFLGENEMHQIKNRNDSTISQHKNKLYLYYGMMDGWVPIRYYEDLKKRFPDIDAHLCKRSFRHAFVLQDSVEMGQMIGDMINKSIDST
ncbi:lipid droplet-associated hydrolase [Copidosoma floridanum]|uniref:lipid droplet-associated hydrolase n=1 Tax=Copidosoma floridanum TaxID=29053 RepID=UPI0006C9E4DD|nr:lipid droplet-associated hydrolase [Copidosoma floridanum]XP_014212971.1 lipid droplet-associated hydrolase [Copidosoma floridanum]XP_014212972.1 lipid droplet-associated hydrolase [Copidosoma floridanum]